MHHRMFDQRWKKVPHIASRRSQLAAIMRHMRKHSGKDAARLGMARIRECNELIRIAVEASATANESWR